MPNAIVNGARLFYQEVGQGDETVVFSHSYLINGDHFLPQMEALQSKYRCVAFDHRGHGRSEVARDGYELENLYQDAVAFIEHLDCGPCHFVGLSTGGFIGTRLAIRRPDLLRSVVLMDTSADAEPRGAQLRYRLMILALLRLGYGPIIGAATKILFGPTFLSDRRRRQEVKHWRSTIMASDRTAMAKFGRGIFGRASVYEQLQTIAIPTLVVVGEDDRATPVHRARRMADRIPGARLEIVPQAGHLSTVEQPTAVNDVLCDFLAAN